MKPHRANVVLVLGILSLVMTCLPFGFPAWFMGNRDLREMEGGLMDPSGRDTTNAGRICGIIGTALFVLWFISMIVFFAMTTFMHSNITKMFETMQNVSKQHAPGEVTPAPAP
jgi:hypothetical protein